MKIYIKLFTNTKQRYWATQTQISATVHGLCILMKPYQRIT